MNKYLITPALAIGAALLLNAGSASAGGTPTEVCDMQVCLRLTATAVDSDGDGFTDAVEKTFGTNPFDANSHPPVLDVVNDITDGTLPDFWLEPEFELITAGPDGTPIVPGNDFGLDIPSRTDTTGVPSIPGLNLDGLGDNGLGDLDGLGGSGQTTAPNLPGKPNTDLISAGGLTWHRESGSSHVYPDGSRDVLFGYTAHDPTSGDDLRVGGTRSYDRDGNLLGATNEFVRTGKDGTEKESLRSKTEVTPGNPDVSKQAEADANTELADAANAANKKAADDKKKKDDEDAAAKKKKDAGGYYNADAEPAGSNPFAGKSQYEIDVAMNAAMGGEYTHFGDTGIDLTGAVPEVPYGEVIHTDPDAGEIVVIEGDPINYGEAQPEVDPDRPTPDFQGGVLNTGGGFGAPGDRG